MRKRRTRGHIIADLSVNYVERYVLLCGHTLERVTHDYGIDLILHTYDVNGEAEPDAIYLQLKATDSLPLLQDGQTLALAVERADLSLWLAEVMPVILVLYDAASDRAYWIYVQAYFTQLPGFSLNQIGETITLHIPVTNRINEEAIRQFARYKAQLRSRIQREITHHE